jgi:hypothetical protein
VWYFYLYWLDELAVAKHNIEGNHLITFRDTRVLAGAPSYMDETVKEATNMWLHLEHSYRDTGCNLSLF